MQRDGEPDFTVLDCIETAGNVYEPGAWEIVDRHEAGGPGKWKVKDHKFGPGEHADFAELAGFGADARIQPIPDADDPMTLPQLKNSQGQLAGARIVVPLTVGVRTSE
jgi:hypothetical protein